MVLVLGVVIGAIALILLGAALIWLLLATICVVAAAAALWRGSIQRPR
jgi:hypothetical protein